MPNSAHGFWIYNSQRGPRVNDALTASHAFGTLLEVGKLCASGEMWAALYDKFLVDSDTVH